MEGGEGDIQKRKTIVFWENEKSLLAEKGNLSCFNAIMQSFQLFL